MSESLIDRTKRHEGCRLKVYTDTLGVPTIGYGRNLQDRGISQAEADAMLQRDIEEAWDEVGLQIPFSEACPPIIREVLTEMCFQMGITRLLGFKKALAAMEARDYSTAADEMLDSAWATQTPARAKELSDLVRGAGEGET